MEFAGKNFDVVVLELPIFSVHNQEESRFVLLVANVMSMKRVTMYPKGGSKKLELLQECKDGSILCISLGTIA